MVVGQQRQIQDVLPLARQREQTLLDGDELWDTVRVDARLDVAEFDLGEISAQNRHELARRVDLERSRPTRQTVVFALKMNDFLLM